MLQRGPHGRMLLGRGRESCCRRASALSVWEAGAGARGLEENSAGEDETRSCPFVYF